MRKTLFYFALGFFCWSCSNNEYEDIIEESIPEKSTRSTVYEYPDANGILADSYIADQMRTAWEKTKESAKQDRRREYGFVITSVLTGKNSYAIGATAIQAGPVIEGTGRGQFSFKNTPANYCGFFHTHTPLTYVEGNYKRKTGPSQEDGVIAVSAPHFIYDYKAATITTGHDINMETKIYVIGPKRRMR